MTPFEESERRVAIADARSLFEEHKDRLTQLAPSTYKIINILEYGHAIGPNSLVITNQLGRTQVWIECEYEDDAGEVFMETFEDLIKNNLTISVK